MVALKQSHDGDNDGGDGKMGCARGMDKDAEHCTSAIPPAAHVSTRTPERNTAAHLTTAHACSGASVNATSFSFSSSSSFSSASVNTATTSSLLNHGILSAGGSSASSNNGNVPNARVGMATLTSTSVSHPIPSRSVVPSIRFISFSSSPSSMASSSSSSVTAAAFVDVGSLPSHSSTSSASAALPASASSISENDHARENGRILSSSVVNTRPVTLSSAAKLNLRGQAHRPGTRSRPPPFSVPDEEMQYFTTPDPSLSCLLCQLCRVTIAQSMPAIHQHIRTTGHQTAKASGIAAPMALIPFRMQAHPSMHDMLQCTACSRPVKWTTADINHHIQTAQHRQALKAKAKTKTRQ